MRNLIVFSTLLLLFVSCKKEMPLLKANRDQEIMLSIKSFLAAEMSPQEWTKVQFSDYSIARAGDTVKAVLVECKKLYEWGSRWVVVTPTAASWSASIMELEYRDSLKQEGRAGWYALNGLPLRTLPVSKGRLVKGGAAEGSRSFGMEVPVEVMVNYTSFLNYQYAVLCNMYGGPGGENFYIQMPGGGGGSGYGTDNMIEIEFDDSENSPAVDIRKMMKCFDQVPDGTDAVYSITLCADVPSNDRPTELIGGGSGSTSGHAFIILTKTNGNNSVTQVFGFYPVNGKSSLGFSPVSSKMVNDSLHEINASIKMNLTQYDFD